MIGTRRGVERTIVAFLFVLISLSAAFTQKPARIFADAGEYLAMAQQYATGFTGVSVAAPFVYRVATPWFAAWADTIVTPAIPRWLDLMIDDATGMDGVPGFYAVNIVASFAAAMLLVSFLRHFIQHATVRLILVAFWMIQWHAIVRYTYFNPVNIEPVFFVCLLTGLLAITRLPDTRLAAGAYAVSVLVLAGTLVRESMVLVAAAFAARYFRSWRSTGRRAIDLVPGVLPCVAAALGLLCSTRFLGVPLHPADPWAVPMEMIRTKSPWMWILAWFFTVGPVALGIIAAAWREGRRLLRARSDLAVYLAGCALLAYVGGTDTERILGWAMPVVLILLGLGVETYSPVLRRSPMLIALFTAAVLVSSRIFWPIPSGPEDQIPVDRLAFDWPTLYAVLDKVFVIDNYYANLWSSYGSRPIHMALLVADLAVAAAVIAAVTKATARSPLPAGQ